MNVFINLLITAALRLCGSAAMWRCGAAVLRLRSFFLESALRLPVHCASLVVSDEAAVDGD